MGCGASKGDAAASVSHLKLDRHRSKELWSDLRRRLHIGSDLENAVARDDLFTLMDIQRKGRLTFPQILDGCDRIIGLPELTDNIEPIVARAFKAACAQDRKKGRTISINMRKELNNTIERSEFLAFLTYVRDYFELWVMFDEVDSSDDFAITLDEFKAAIPLIEKWGRGVRIKDPVAKFNEIDTNNTKSISFIEFAEWAIIEQLDFDGDDDDKGAVAPPPSKVEPDYLAMIQACAKKKQVEITKFKKLKSRLPLDQHSQEDIEKRSALFKKFDTIKNRRLTLPEVIVGCRNVIHLIEFTPHSDVIASHAFSQARRGCAESAPNVKKTIGFLEFRLLLCYIYDYFELMYMFSLIDSNDEEVDNTVIAMKNSSMVNNRGGSSTMKQDPLATSANAFISSGRVASANRSRSPNNTGSERGANIKTVVDPMNMSSSNTNQHLVESDNHADSFSDSVTGIQPPPAALKKNSGTAMGASAMGNTLTVPTNTHGVSVPSNRRDPATHHGGKDMEEDGAPPPPDTSGALIDFSGGEGKSYQSEDPVNGRMVSVGGASMALSVNPHNLSDDNFISYEELAKGKEHLAAWLNRPVTLTKDGHQSDIANASSSVNKNKAQPQQPQDPSKMKPLTISEIFKAADADGDNKITFMEFVSWAVRHKLDAEGEPRYLASGREAKGGGLSHRGGGVSSMPGGSLRF